MTCDTSGTVSGYLCHSYFAGGSRDLSSLKQSGKRFARRHMLFSCHQCLTDSLHGWLVFVPAFECETWHDIDGVSTNA